jgi:Ca-activated chloride channel family protein
VILQRGSAALQAGALSSCRRAPIAAASHQLTPECGALRARLRVNQERAIVSVHRGALRHAEGRFVAGTTVALAPGRAADPLAVHRGEAAAQSEPDWRSSAPGREDVDLPARGLGRMTARLPGTETIVGGVRLASHEVRVTVHDGFARTEVVEEFVNESDRVLEGRFVFPLPADASISRLALWVGPELVEGEMLERKRAARIFKGIVDDTVRPRDPALLEWLRGSEFSLKIFPIPARGSRKVLLAYNQALPRHGQDFEYRYPLSLGSERATTIDRFAIRVQAHDSRARLRAVETPAYPTKTSRDGEGVRLSYDDTAFTPARDFVMRYRLDRAVQEQPAVHFSDVNSSDVNSSDVNSSDADDGEGLAERSRAAQRSNFVALRLRATPTDELPPRRASTPRVLVLDRSSSQGEASWSSQLRMAEGLVARLDAPFALLACDTDCDAFPDSGLADAGAIDAARLWLAKLQRGGASDLGGALDAGVKRLGDDSGQLIYLGDGGSSAGHLSAERIAAELAPALAERVDLRMLGVGTTVDEVMLEGIAALAGASYERVPAARALEDTCDHLTLRLQTPVIRRPSLDTGELLSEVHPRQLPNVLLGDELMVMAKLTRPGTGKLALRGTLEGQSYQLAKTIDVERSKKGNPLVPRLWAEAEIAALQRSDDDAVIRRVVELSKEHHVMSRHTALLVLENERMFREFGVQRTQRRIGEATASAAGHGRGSAGASNDVGSVGTIGHGAASGSMWGNDIGGSFGSGGLGLSGIGAGGGARGQAFGSGQGFGGGSGRLGRSHRARPPRVRMGMTAVSGRLPPEVIQRIVRMNFGRFRLCYEQGLLRNPELSGRVTVRFVIGRDGKVTVATGQSAMGDQAVVSCIANAFYRLTFPQPEGGIVTVSYPIVLTPSDGGAGQPPPGQGRVDVQRHVAQQPARRRTTQPARRRRGWQRPGWRGQHTASVVHYAANDDWRRTPISALDRWRKLLERSPRSRRAHERLIRGLLRHGRFDEALRRAEHFHELDPDLPAAGELLAYAAAVNGMPLRAARSMSLLVESNPRDAGEQQRAARAFQSLGQLTRACAHWQAAAQLLPKSDENQWHALACVARRHGHRAAAQRVRELPRASKRLRQLATELDQGRKPELAAATGAMGWFEATSDCRADDCPYLAIIGDDGRVYSPWTPARARAASEQVACGARKHRSRR